jgi:alginate O-acetyltransferase complex protein AlgI
VQLLLFSIVVNIGILGYFKYAEFLLETFGNIMSTVGILYSPPELDIILPIGISFYTFQTLSYTIDVYRKKIRPTESLLDFSLFVTFFPQLVAGPIVRAGDFLPQCIQSKRIKMPALVMGVSLIVWGIFQKTVLADALFSPLADEYFYSTDFVVYGASLSDAWLALFSFSMQIYYDFAGYSLCAVGAAIALGFRLPDNFNAPYAASGFSDFWRRWHISLSQWMRDYLYIPMGGNRAGRVKSLRNLVIVMFLGGLWHGASWNFVIWGLLHGVFLVVEHSLKNWRHIQLPALLGSMVTFVLVSLLWVPFRSPDLASSIVNFEQLFDWTKTLSTGFTMQQKLALAAIILTLGYQYMRRNFSLTDLVARVPYWLQAALLSVAILLIALSSTGDTHAFIYFQF